MMAKLNGKPVAKEETTGDEKLREMIRDALSAAGFVPHYTVANGDAVITLDFSGHKDVYERLAAMAKENFRDPDQQALYCINQMMQAAEAA